MPYGAGGGGAVSATFACPLAIIQTALEEWSDHCTLK